VVWNILDYRSVSRCIWQYSKYQKLQLKLVTSLVFIYFFNVTAANYVTCQFSIKGLVLKMLAFFFYEWCITISTNSFDQLFWDINKIGLARWAEADSFLHITAIFCHVTEPTPCSYYIFFILGSLNFLCEILNSQLDSFIYLS